MTGRVFLSRYLRKLCAIYILLGIGSLSHNSMAEVFSSIPSADAYGYGTYPDLPYGPTATPMAAGWAGPFDPSWWSSQIQWDLPEDIVGATINSASITLPLRYGVTENPSTVALQAYNLPWDEATTTHRHRDAENLWTGATLGDGGSIGGKGGYNDRVNINGVNTNFDTQVMPVAPMINEITPAATVIFDAKSLIEFWAAGNPNYGAAFEIIEPINLETATVFTYWPREFIPFGGSAGDLAPVLDIDYTPGTGNTYWEADFNQDENVDGEDFLIWQRGGSTNGLNSGDLALWQAQYGNTGFKPLVAAANVVPEPVSLYLLVVAFGTLLPGRCRLDKKCN